MALWLVRAGSKGEREEFALENKVALIGWSSLPDLRTIDTREKLLTVIEDRYPGEKRKKLMNWESQIWPFLRVMAINDLVALPLKRRAAIAIGRIVGEYKFHSEFPSDAQHTREVEWLREIPRSSFPIANRNSLGAFMTVCRLQKHGIEQTVKNLLEGRMNATASALADEDVTPEEQLNLQETSDAQIREYVATHFKGHELERLVEAVLQAKGYAVQRTAKGADGGVDLVAGHGPMGFASPRMIVQVKSEDAPIDVKVLRELKGVMKDFSAEHGLIVAWGGFKGSFDKEAMRHYFEVRLWTGDDLIREIQTVYDDLPESMRAEIPLQRIWTLALEAD